MAIARIADLPLPEREPLELLALDVDRDAPDADYAGFGRAFIDDVELAAPDRPSARLSHALVIALHSADEQRDRDDVELLFELPGESVLVPLSKWLAAVLPSLPAADEVVLALCNPNRVPIAVPADATHPRIHYAHGDVTSWLDFDAGGGHHVRLSARRWCIAERP
ncbi:MAG TPA: hypothetical protein VG755_18765 [Nannocystaceae bacterium]|nr:hypothetical protein [Nannocystaceae bacterium]